MENAENINLFADEAIGKIRCKMNINSIKDTGSSVRVEMGAVYSSRPDSENKSFATATPSAFFSMDIAKTAPASRAPWLTPGAQVYVDLSLADIPEWNWSSDRNPEADRRVEIRIGTTIENEPIRGIFRLGVDEEFKKLARNTSYYPSIDSDDGLKIKLYDWTLHRMTYFWKYIE